MCWVGSIRLCVPKAARVIGLRAGTDAEIDAAFETVAQQRVAALPVAADPFFDTRRCFTEARRKRCGLTAVINRYAQQRPSQSSDTQRA